MLLVVQMQFHTRRMFNREIAKIPPLVGSDGPGPSCFVEESFLFNRLGVVDLGHSRTGVEDFGTFLADATPLVVNSINRRQIPLFSYEPVVTFFGGTIFGMKIIVGLEEAAILEMFIRATYFLSDKPAQIPKQVWIILVVAFASFQKIDPATNIVVAVPVVIEFNRKVVTNVPGLKLPEGNKVRLQLGELVECGGQIRPVFCFFVVVCLFPEQVHSHPA